MILIECPQNETECISNATNEFRLYVISQEIFIHPHRRGAQGTPRYKSDILKLSHPHILGPP